MKTDKGKLDMSNPIYRKFLRKHFNLGKPVDCEPLWQKSRVYCGPDDYESYREYGFLGVDMTDEEINEAVNEMWIHIYSQYDCTGKPFTQWIDTHANPSGFVSFVHSIGIDV